MHLFQCFASLFYDAASSVGAVWASTRLFPKWEPVLVVATVFRDPKGTATVSLDWPSQLLFMIRLRHGRALKQR
jgi:hypothetical protein